MDTCPKCNGCGWENPAQAVDRCSACNGAGMVETVSVPRELLNRVLDEAWENLTFIAHERNCTQSDHDETNKKLSEIEELRDYCK